MAAFIGLVTGLVIGFIIGWLVRDARRRALLAPGDRFGVGVPADWERRQREDGDRR